MKVLPLQSLRVHQTALELMLIVLACSILQACTPMQMYRHAVPIGPPADCKADGDGGSATSAITPCEAQATESNSRYTLHFVEFDDEGSPFDNLPSSRDAPPTQIDSAVDQIRNLLKDPQNCVRLFVYVHGWHHDAETNDRDVISFRSFLESASKRPTRARSTDYPTACDKSAGPTTPQTPAGKTYKTVGIYVGWRGDSIYERNPGSVLTFWDRKSTAERVSQGSTRELFGRLSALASNPPSGTGKTDAPKNTGQLRTYVISHSFGAAIAFRALSQSLIDSFSSDLDGDKALQAQSVSRFVDMVVLVNPAIEAARFDAVYRAAARRKARCDLGVTPGPCDQPKYQTPVLAIFQSEGDGATGQAFPLSAAITNRLEKTVNDRERRSIDHTIGWNDDFKTHVLQTVDKCPDNGLQNPYEPGADGVARYRAPGWIWCFDGLALTQVGKPSAPFDSHTIYNGPLWNVRVSETIMKSHSDIWNPVFRSILIKLFTDEEIYNAL